MLKALKFLLPVFITFGLFQCKDAEDPAEEQRRKDKQKIEKYALDNDLSGSFLSDLYKVVVTEGTGSAIPLNNEGVEVHYTLSLLEGGILQSGESFYQHGQFFYIYGWELGVSTMKEGEVAKFLIPSNMGYGKTVFDLGNVSIPANSVLILDIELVKITSVANIPGAYASLKGLTNGKSTSTGLYYAIGTQGSGNTPVSGQKVTVKYNGYLLNGYSFDHSDSYTFEMGSESKGLIQGWQEAIPLLKKGDKAVLVIPSNLAYGVNGAVERDGTVRIPPNAVIIFDIEILDIK